MIAVVPSFAWGWVCATFSCRMARIDHVMVAVRDLDAAAERMWREFGLEAGVITARLGDSTLPIRCRGGRSGVQAVGIASDAGDIVLRF